jgi:prepilin-type N-terminal cleavage/methylation domain-containing protein
MIIYRKNVITVFYSVIWCYKKSNIAGIHYERGKNMFKFLRRNKKGFTLIELIVVFAIIAILAAIAIPTFAGITNEADKAVEIANARSIATAINAHNALNPDSQIASITTASALETAIGPNLWPTGLPSDMGLTLNRISISGGIATVNTGDVTPSTGT